MRRLMVLHRQPRTRELAEVYYHIGPLSRSEHQPPDLEPGRHGSVEVAFASRRGRDAADHEIVAMVAADPDPGGIQVVTSDRRLAERVRDLGATVEPSSRFRGRVDRALETDPYR